MFLAWRRLGLVEIWSSVLFPAWNTCIGTQMRLCSTCAWRSGWCRTKHSHTDTHKQRYTPCRLRSSSFPPCVKLCLYCKLWSMSSQCLDYRFKKLLRNCSVCWRSLDYRFWTVGSELFKLHKRESALLCFLAAYQIRRFIPLSWP